jgi:3' terminal RNA ribose 2'-O-methyltransferase Hen1
MLLTISTTHQPATDLGYLLAKNPARAHAFDLPFGRAHVFYPEATRERCTAALLLDIDPVALVRDGEAFDQYVNDRPWVASSFMSVAIGRVFGTALGGRSRERPELTDTPIPLVARLAAAPCRGGERFWREVFEPLGYAVTATNHPLGEPFGPSRYFTVDLAATTTLRDDGAARSSDAGLDRAHPRVPRRPRQPLRVG